MDMEGQKFKSSHVPVQAFERPAAVAMLMAMWSALSRDNVLALALPGLGVDLELAGLGVHVSQALLFHCDFLLTPWCEHCLDRLVVVHLLVKGSASHAQLFADEVLDLVLCALGVVVAGQLVLVQTHHEVGSQGELLDHLTTAVAAHHRLDEALAGLVLLHQSGGH